MNDEMDRGVDDAAVMSIPYHKLIKGTRNVRTVKPNNTADKRLIANIKAVGGLLQNLVVEPSVSSEGYYEVIAGGRRWSSVGVLAKRCDFAEDFPMPCKIIASGSAVAVSLSENIHAPMHGYSVTP